MARPRVWPYPPLPTAKEDAVAADGEQQDGSPKQEDNKKKGKQAAQQQPGLWVEGQLVTKPTLDQPLSLAMSCRLFVTAPI